MFTSRRVRLVVVISLCWTMQSGMAADDKLNPDTVLNKERMKPAGEFYEATVPDTLDLADRAKWSINGLLGNMDPSQYYGVYQGFSFDQNPPKLLALTWNITVKNVRTLPTLRIMCGSDVGLDHEYGAMRALMSGIREDGLLYYSFDGSGPPKGTSYPQTNASMMFAMLNWYGRDGNPEWLKWVDLLIQGLEKVPITVGDRAFYPMQSGIDPEGRWHIMNSGSEPPYGQGEHAFTYIPTKEPESDAEGYEGSAKAESNRTMAALAKYYQRTGDPETLELIEKLLRFVLKPSMWRENSDEERYPGYEHGIWMGHFHNGGNQAMLGLLDVALATNNEWLKRFVREGYEHTMRNGVIRLGYFPAWSIPEKCGDRPAWLGDLTEPCALGDIVMMAVRMSDAGLGDYWDDVDYLIRNHLLEQQIIDLDQMRKVSGAAPDSPGDKLLEQFRGSFAGCSPTRVHQYSLAGCCTANGPQAFYYAWHGITRFDEKNKAASVNLFLNRASQWMDVDSYLPYEGKVVLHNKKARTALVRIPGWVDADKVQCRIEQPGLNGADNTRPVTPSRVGSRLVFTDLKGNENIILEFPVPTWSDRYTVAGKKYSITFKGSTVVDISPRDEGNYYQLYLDRAKYLGKTTPMIKKQRFASETIIPLGIF